MSPDPLRVAGALVVDDDGRIFFQRRSPARKLFPNTWDIVGGHLESGETVNEALRREVLEETGWRVSVVLGPVGTYTYTGDDGLDRHESGSPRTASRSCTLSVCEPTAILGWHAPHSEGSTP